MKTKIDSKENERRRLAKRREQYKTVHKLGRIRCGSYENELREGESRKLGILAEPRATYKHDRVTRF